MDFIVLQLIKYSTQYVGGIFGGEILEILTCKSEEN